MLILQSVSDPLSLTHGVRFPRSPPNETPCNQRPRPVKSLTLREMMTLYGKPPIIRGASEHPFSPTLCFPSVPTTPLSCIGFQNIPYVAPSFCCVAHPFLKDLKACPSHDPGPPPTRSRGPNFSSASVKV
jgi:hypothetical protein